MATRGKTTFQKRQKEMARKDKRQLKEERRAQRKLNPEAEPGDDIGSAADMQPPMEPLSEQPERE